MNNEKFIAPQFDLNAFTCPHCQVVAQMRFIIPNELEERISEQRFVIREIATKSYKNNHLREIEYNKIKSSLIKIGQKIEYYETYANAFCVCQVCKKISIWINQKMVYPKVRLTPLPNEDLPDEIKADYEEASLIVQDSPRGACALLRLALQKLMIHLGEDRNLDKAIKNLIDNNKIDETLQKALDSVRVIGNNATHPNELDIKDNQEIAIALFNIINYIAEKILSNKKQIDEIYSLLPENAKRENRTN